MGSTALSLALHDDNFEPGAILIASRSAPRKSQHCRFSTGGERWWKCECPEQGRSRHRYILLSIKEGLKLSCRVAHAQDNNRSTPLHLASDDGSFELVKLLIQCGAYVNARATRRTRHRCTYYSIAVSRTGRSRESEARARFWVPKQTHKTIKAATTHRIAGGSPSMSSSAYSVTTLAGRADTNTRTREHIGDGDRRTPLHLASQDKKLRRSFGY